NQPNVAGSGPTWLFDIDNLTQSMNYQPVFAWNQPNHNASIQENSNAGTVRKEAKSFQQYVLLPLWSIGLKDPQNTDDDAAFDVKELESEVHVSPSSSDKIKKHDEKAKSEANGKSPVDLSPGVRDLNDEFKEFFINSTNEVNAASTPVTAVGQNSTNSTNSFNVAGPFDNAVSPTFEIGGKYSFVDTSQYPDDPNMPALEEIVYSHDEAVVVTEADFSNLETSITVSPIPTTRVHNDHPVTQIISGLSSAPQTRSMARMVKEQARIEAIQLFLAYASFMGYMVYQMDVKSTFLYGTFEEEVYDGQPPRFEDPDYLDKVYKVVKHSWGCIKLLELVKQKEDGIFISQDKYVAEILRKFGLTDGKLASTPIDTDKPLLKDPNGEDVDVHTYRSMIGSLMYLTLSRPDIMFVVCACARFYVTPKVSHLHAVKRIFRYLKGKPHLGLWYPKDLPFNLVAYSDSDYAGASLDRKSTTGGCQFIGCRLISWQCKKQTVVATSSTEAEYVADAS
nr:uncharacterized mitochondrial protein AtMg00810-like [Tanacetum cinerariifolium]